MNIQLLRQIQQAIREEPLRFDMSGWVNRLDVIAPCGTTACIAGYAIAFDEESRRPKLEDKVCQWRAITDVVLNSAESYTARAARLLQITFEQAEYLFYSRSWPKPFSDAYQAHWNAARLWAQEPDRERAAKARRQAAEVAINRIEHFIQTGG